MNKSDSIKEIATALAKFQAEIANPKNTADNPFFKSKYAPLCDILTVARPLLSKFGLSVIQAPGGDGERIGISTLIMHISGEWIETPELILKAAKVDPQGAGSAITYGRRYALSAVLGISSEDDDDGNHASKGKKDKAEPSTQPPTPPKPAAPPPISSPAAQPPTPPPQPFGGEEMANEPQIKMLFAKSKSKGLELHDVLADFGLESTKHVTKKMVNEIVKHLDGK